MNMICIVTVIVTLDEHHTYALPNMMAAMDKLEVIKRLHPAAHAITAQLVEVEDEV